jgi:hypothetical protein
MAGSGAQPSARRYIVRPVPGPPDRVAGDQLGSKRKLKASHNPRAERLRADDGAILRSDPDPRPERGRYEALKPGRWPVSSLRRKRDWRSAAGEVEGKDVPAMIVPRVDNGLARVRQASLGDQEPAAVLA